MSVDPTAAVVRDGELGVYVHVPYCRQHCPYCDFNIHVIGEGTAPWSDFGAALLAELEARSEVYAPRRAATIYFGGGTPSLAPAPFVAGVIDAVRGRFGLGPEAEITLEVDPGTAGEEDLRAFAAAGVSRLSIGWQSTHDPVLKLLGRGHDAATAQRTLREARAAGFDNISIDLIFAVPGQTMAMLERDLDALEAAAPEHVSLYALTWETRTTFTKLRDRGRLEAVSEDLEAAMLERIDARLGAAGLDRYEVSNYARPGRRARHNSAYWSGVPYLGLGPGAHSFAREGWERGWRWEGVRRPWKYIDRWRQGTGGRGRPASGDRGVEWVEALDGDDLLRERLLTSLRTHDGIVLDDPVLGARGATVTAAVISAARAARERGWLQPRTDALVPTREGLRFADALAALFF